MRTWLCVGLVVTTNLLGTSASWTTGPIPNSPNGAYEKVSLTYDPSLNQVFAAWSNNSTGIPYYSSYNGSAWSTNTIPTGSSSGAKKNVSLGYNPNLNSVFAAWANLTTTVPYYSTTQNGIDWTTNPISQNSPGSVQYDISLAYDSDSHVMFAAWANGSGPPPLYYTTYSGSWAVADTIPLGGSSGSYLASLTASPSLAFLAWVDGNTAIPYFSTYDGTSWSTGTITNSPNGAYGLVALTYNANTSDVFAAWADAGTNRYPYYSVYDGFSWTTNLISNSYEVQAGITLAYQSTNHDIFAAWTDKTSGAPIAAIYDGTSWAIGAIPNSPDGVFEDVSLAYDANSGVMVAVWVNNVYPWTPYYSIYTSGWGAATLFPNSPGGVADQISLVYEPVSQTIIAAWADNDSLAPYYSIYNGTTSPAAPIPLGTSSGAYGDVSLTCDSSGVVYAVWQDTASKNFYYSTNSGSGWRTAVAISPAPSDGTGSIIALTYDASASKVVAVWPNASPYGAPYFSKTSDGVNWTTSAISLGTSRGAYQDVSLAYNPNSHLMFAVWADSNSGAPYYSTYDGSIWSTGTIANSPNGVDQTVSVSYDANTNTMIAAWSDSTTREPYYSSYDGISWTTSTINPGASNGVQRDVSLTYDSSAELAFAAWGDKTSPYLPYASTYNGSSWSTSSISNSPNGVYRYVSLTYNATTNAVFAAWTDDGSDSAPYYSIYAVPSSFPPSTKPGGGSFTPPGGNRIHRGP